MARVLVVSDRDPALAVTDEDEPSWDGPCSGCGWTATYGGTRHTTLDDAVQDAIVHLDHQH